MTLPDFKTYNSIVIKTVRNRYQNIRLVQWNRTENSETGPHLYE